MSKRGERREKEALYAKVTQIARMGSDSEKRTDTPETETNSHDEASISDEMLAASVELRPLLALESRERRAAPLMKKFRFQLLHEWLTNHLPPCRVADVGGGKGLLAHLLRGSGWDATVIDPAPQLLPTKYKRLADGRQIRIDPAERIPRIDREFEAEMARDFDLLVAMHAHGCNVKLIDTAAEYHREAVLLPCCIIQEPIHPSPGVHWIQEITNYAVGRGFRIEPFRLNFKGQNIGLALRTEDSVRHVR